MVEDLGPLYFNPAASTQDCIRKEKQLVIICYNLKGSEQ